MIKHVHVNECDSTQELLKEQMAHGPSDDLLLVSCENQLNGRGRGENTWTSMPGTLCFSFNLKPSVVISFTALEISLLIVKYLEQKGVQLKLKWPNDIWDERGKKCAGILVQAQQHHYLAGVGLNLFSEHSEFGSIYSHAKVFDKKPMALELVEFIHAHRFSEVETLRAAWELRCAHLNREVTITENNEREQGVFLGLGAHGEAMLKTKSRTLHLYNGTLRLT